MSTSPVRRRAALVKLRSCDLVSNGFMTCRAIQVVLCTSILERYQHCPRTDHTSEWLVWSLNQFSEMAESDSGDAIRSHLPLLVSRHADNCVHHCSDVRQGSCSLWHEWCSVHVFVPISTKNSEDLRLDAVTPTCASVQIYVYWI